MNSDSIWKPNTGPQWLQALALPAQPWVKPFLGRMKFPPALTNEHQFFQAIHTEAAEKRTALWRANEELGYLPELDTAITREFVTEALKQLEAKVDSSVVNEFKDWACQNFIRSELAGVLLAWRVVLRHVCQQGNSVYAIVPPPQSLLPLLPRVAELVSYEYDRAVHDELHQLSPPNQDEDGLGLDISPQAMTVEEIIRNESTREALRFIMHSLPESAQEEVLSWAKKQAIEQQIQADLFIDSVLFELE